MKTENLVSVERDIRRLIQIGWPSDKIIDTLCGQYPGVSDDSIIEIAERLSPPKKEQEAKPAGKPRENVKVVSRSLSDNNSHFRGKEIELTGEAKQRFLNKLR